MIKKVLLFLLLSFALASCSVSMNDRGSDADDSAYGSLSVSQRDVSRAIDTNDITKAYITVTSSDFSEIYSDTTTVSGGSGTASFDKIPVGSNRVITVQAQDDNGNLSGVVMYGLCNITSGANTCNVTWTSSIKAKLYSVLLSKGYKIASEDYSSIESYIPSNLQSYEIDYDALVSDYASSSLSTSKSYEVAKSTVTLKVYGLTGTVRLNDPLSSAVEVSGDDTVTFTTYAGTWSVYFSDGTTSTCYKTITVTSGEDCDAGYIGDPLKNKFMIFVKGSSAPTIWTYSRTSSGTVKLDYLKNLGKSWPGVIMESATSSMMNNPEGWYYIDLSSLGTTPDEEATTSIHINGGSDIKTGVTSLTTFWYDGSSFYTSDPTTASDPDPIEDGDSVKIYVSSSSAPSFWVWQPSGKACSELMGYKWASQPTMDNATDLIYNEGWYVFEIGSKYYTSGKTFAFNINSTGDTETTKTKTFWYDAIGTSGTKGTYYDSDPTTKPEPVSPTVTVKPASGKKVGPTSSISVTFDYGYDEENFSATVTVNGKTYKWGTDFTGSLSLNIANDLGITSDSTITIKAECSNSVSSASDSSTIKVDTSLADDPFTWDNVNAYFVLTDRFYNGDSSNDHSYYRKNGLTGDENVATFHGGDIAGLTQKLDYFDKLGVNAIWITAPYEQAHGWVGGKNNAFPHYAFHGYYTLDWSSMDQNMGTVEELRTFVNACHSKGIRVIMDVVMNHTGYNNTEDMITFNYGYTEHKEHGWLAKTDGLWDANDSVKWDASYWDSTWYGPWIRSFGYDSGSEYGGSCGGLPDVKTELTESVGMAPVLTTKWGQDSDSYKSSYYNPSVANADWNGYSGDYRKDRNLAPADYQIIYLSAWVREVGIDGFRCDTAKHVEPWRWGQLKVACQAALEAWREDSSKDKTYNGSDTGAADWDESFWMTGECFGWTSTQGEGEYYTTGKFDSMINFSFNGSQTTSNSTNYPSTSSWSSYASINNNSDSDGNGNRNNVLTYLSSHDTTICRASNQKEVGTMFELLPGGVQIYYGDECSRPRAYTGCGDSDMMTRGDMDFSINTDCTAHWGKVGNFRKYNPAVGAGNLVDGSSCKRSYSGTAGDNKIAISISGTSVDVSNLFSDGTTVYNWYDGKSATVSGGKVSFAGGTTTQPILVSDKNPSNFGLSF